MSTRSRSLTSPVSASSSHVAAAPPASPPPGVAAARAAVAAAAWGVPAGCSAVTVSLDGREVARTRIGAGAPASAPPLDVDVSDARRLTLAIEFAAEGDVGCPVRLGDPAFEQ